MSSQTVRFVACLSWRNWLLALAATAPALELPAQSAARPPIPTIEPGLEHAVKWRWRAEPGDPADWGLSLDARPPAHPAAPSSGREPSPAVAAPAGPPLESFDHEVRRGDSLYAISRRTGVSIESLKQANALKSDIIRVGQMLRIPSLAEIQAMSPPAVEKSADESGKDPAPKETPQAQRAPPKPAASPRPATSRPLPPEAARVSRVVLMQAFLSRRLFSAGPIDGSDGPLYEATLDAFKQAWPGVLETATGEMPPALLEMGGAYREYQLRAGDFRWIQPQPPAPPAARGGKTPAPPPPSPTLESLTAGRFLAYHSAWEFVAERFHCSETFLRGINKAIRSTPAPGTVFLVPNVEPFEIENLFETPLQPAADEQSPVKARILKNTLLEVWRGEQLIARMPVSAARPGLRGRGQWRILEAVPRPRLVTTGEFSSQPKPGALAEASSSQPDTLILPAGPNNPAGPIWIHLAKSGADEPLPYGLHGTSIPGMMHRQESLGGFRLANWDLARVVRLLPPGTPLQWDS